MVLNSQKWFLSLRHNVFAGTFWKKFGLFQLFQEMKNIHAFVVEESTMCLDGGYVGAQALVEGWGMWCIFGGMGKRSKKRNENQSSKYGGG